jgi:WD40 repeat protein
MVAVQRVSLAGVFVLAVATAAAAQPVVLSGHTAPVSSVEWSPDGKMIASCGHDNTVRVWDVLSGESAAPRPRPANTARPPRSDLAALAVLRENRPRPT